MYLGCPDGRPPVVCAMDPCTATVCRANPLAVCRANYCGGCNADFYDQNGNIVYCQGECFCNVLG